MKKIRINPLFFVVSLAMISLLLIQFFQVSQLYDRTNAKFKSNVEVLVERIAIRHEKALELRKYIHTVKKDISTEYKDILKKEFQSLLTAKETISIHDTSILEANVPVNYLLIEGTSFDTLSGLKTQHNIMVKDIRELKELFQSDVSKRRHSSHHQMSLQLDQRVMQQLFKKSKIINEMLIQAFKENDLVLPHDRVNLRFLDSIIAFETRSDKLPSDFHFVVLKENGARVSSKESIGHYHVSLDTSFATHSSLFPSNILDEKLVLYLKFPSKKNYLLKEMGLMLSVSLLLVLFILFSISYLFKTILTQKKMSELKNEFISNMTHEFKTPISTISLACQALKDPDLIGEEYSQSAPFVTMIVQENKRLENLVEKILQSASIDRNDLILNLEIINLTHLLRELSANIKFRMRSLEGNLIEQFEGKELYIRGDRMHTTNMISNLLDNAIKYSKSSPTIVISLTQESGFLRLSIKDNGIGISKEHIGKVFDKLYRVPTGNVHNVKGFGLGLSYVKSIVSMHTWEVIAQSDLGKGSTFSIVFPDDSNTINLNY